MFKLGGNGVLRFPNSGHILRFVVHYSKSLQLEANETKSMSLTLMSNYLVKSLGLSEQKAISTSSKLKARLPTKVSAFNVKILHFDSVVNFFQQNGFQQSHIQYVVCSTPNILFAKVDKTLKPKLEAFQKLGLSESDVAQIVSVNPSILYRRLYSKLVPAIQALRAIFGCDEHVFAIIKISNWRVLDSIVKYLVPNVELLQSYGIPFELIQKWVLKQPKCFAMPTESFKGVLMKVEQKWGIPRDSNMFLYGIMVLTSRCERAIELKCKVFKDFGWTDTDILTLFRRNPYSFSSSKERIKKQLNFLMKELGYEPVYLAANPCLITCSLEKRIAPRHRVLLRLKDKGLVKKDYSLLNATKLTESMFLSRFILPFKDVEPNLQESYVKSMGCA